MYSPGLSDDTAPSRTTTTTATTATTTMLLCYYVPLPRPLPLPVPTRTAAAITKRIFNIPWVTVDTSPKFVYTYIHLHINIYMHVHIHTYLINVSGRMQSDSPKTKYPTQNEKFQHMSPDVLFEGYWIWSGERIMCMYMFVYVCIYVYLFILFISFNKSLI